MNLPTLTQAAKGEAYFHEYVQGSLWYRLVYQDDGGHAGELKFPIECSTAGDGAFTQIMKGIYVLRWIRQHIEFIQRAYDEARMP